MEKSSTQELILTRNQLPTDEVVVQASVSTEDVVLIATTQHEERCRQEIAAWQSQVGELSQDLTALDRELDEKTREAAKKSVKELVDVCQAFYLKIFGSFDYEVTTEPSAGEGVAVDVEVFSHRKGKNTYDSATNSLSLPTKELTHEQLGLGDLRVRCANLRKDIQASENELRRWKTELSGLATFERQTRAAVATHSLSQSDRGQAMVAALRKLADERVSGLNAKTKNLADTFKYLEQRPDKAVAKSPDSSQRQEFGDQPVRDMGSIRGSKALRVKDSAPRKRRRRRKPV